ncbi:Conjugal transfer protein TraG [Labrenzia sp. THAF82]|uniref:type IV secretory system conjugative DNA transfer family protein n=1 Tax=Labrenzia sp. THAF82 TaxID=2587861 RepID=UPI001267B13F|nr:type IV secretory system conjugative DNA transfer family protein [Labrenzia sp. THAF82]QFT29577.1 Conjugal transfer protein TraG [Labrenzia sp. THAF82]
MTNTHNLLETVRLASDQAISDCRTIAEVLIDPAGAGLKDFWEEQGCEWLSTVILHVLFQVAREEHRRATLEDVQGFLSSFDKASGDVLNSMESYDHGREALNEAIRRGTARMRQRADNERSAVHLTGASRLQATCP